MERIVVVGAALAGTRAVQSLHAEGFTGEVVVVGAEDHLPYDRPPLSKKLLTGDLAPEAIALRHELDDTTTWLLGRRAVGLDPVARRLRLADGESLAYDGLVVATGSAARRLPTVPHVPGTFLLRTLDDALALRSELVPGARVAVVGTGFIGTEIASTCRDLGLEVTLLGALPVLHRPMGPLSPAAAERARAYGVQVVEGVTVAGLDVDGCVTGVRLDDGTTVPADVVVVAVGAAPVTDWLAGSGAVLEDGVVCDETLAVLGVDDVVAAGDVARWPHPALGGDLLRVEHWTNAAEQGAAAARRLLHGPGVAAFGPVPSFWTDQFATRIQGVGFPTLGPDVTVVDGDPAGRRFVAEYRRAGRLVGAVVAGSPRALLPYRAELQHLAQAPLLPTAGAA
ncbi:FAD-dependent oxidoreductase [Geodermatophilus sp. DSM 44513]|uniref:NAD(P)/FAD-dependent oxidoreductase n=1 Tax=Geodermatophilus sp. DSM 44513 TaxID=1528104 RepID=UPI001412CAB8|nr:FAD-dependent oxidoreductase [Geodermatophilus sp. DSM 44513]WNV77079.1 FAD-dependent oxidoreductase [Geodermatophilus sp. DSM 44513]